MRDEVKQLRAVVGELQPSMNSVQLASFSMLQFKIRGRGDDDEQQPRTEELFITATSHMDSARQYLRAQAFLQEVLSAQQKMVRKGQTVKTPPALTWAVYDPCDQEVLAIGARFNISAQNITDAPIELTLRDDKRLADARREVLELLRDHREQ